jgi:3-hydroxyisobutyrate dehydrogenase
VCSSPAEVAKAAKKIITMLPNGAIVRDVYSNPKTGIFSQLQAGTVLIDSSTIDPQSAQDLAAEAEKLGATLCDAPVSGGINGAAAGTLSFMVGAANDADFKTAEALLGDMAKVIIACGKVGSGQVVKLCNNMILGQHMVAVSEAMLMGTKLGVDAGTLAGVINTSTGRCWSSDSYNPYPNLMPNVPASKEYAGGFGATLMLKDLGLAIDAAKTVQMNPTGALNAQHVYTDMTANPELRELDFSGVIKHIGSQ